MGSVFPYQEFHPAVHLFFTLFAPGCHDITFLALLGVNILPTKTGASWKMRRRSTKKKTHKYHNINRATGVLGDIKRSLYERKRFPTQLSQLVFFLVTSVMNCTTFSHLKSIRLPVHLQSYTVTLMSSEIWIARSCENWPLSRCLIASLHIFRYTKNRAKFA